MLKRILFICLWTLVFFLGGGLVIGFGTAILFAIMSANGATPTSETTRWIGRAWVIVPAVMGFFGFILSVCKRLPGASKPPVDSQEK